MDRADLKRSPVHNRPSTPKAPGLPGIPRQQTIEGYLTSEAIDIDLFGLGRAPQTFLQGSAEGSRRRIMFSESPLCSPPQCIFDHLACRLAQLCVPKLLARDQPAVNSLPQRLTYKRPLDRPGLYQVKNRSQRPSVFVARSGLYFALEQVAIMEHDNSRNIAVTPEVRRNGHLEFGRVQV